MMGSLGAMSTTSKVLLVTAGVGGAVFLLWRFWPKAETEELPPPGETYEPSDDAQKLPDNDFTPASTGRNAPDRSILKASVVPGSCPNGYYWDANTGKCEIWLE